MNKNYPHIFSPLKIKNVTFKNRIFSAPATAHLLQAQEGYPTHPTVSYYAEKARGGSACIAVGAQIMDRYAPADEIHNLTDIFLQKYHRYWNQLTSAIHFHGAKASLELLAFVYHGRKDEVGSTTDGSLNADDGLNSAGGLFVHTVNDISEAEMSRIADDYAQAAEHAISCGFDMILIHGGHGLFLSSFLSPLFNNRKDEYGGTLENRAKFPLKILNRIRERVGDKILIEYRISGSELAPSGGFGIEDCISFLKMAEDKIDIAHISAGNMDIPGTEAVMHPTVFHEAGCNAYLAAAVKASDLKVPVLTLGGFQEPELIEEILASGKADLVSMARGTIADAELVNKAFDGKPQEIIPCIKCFHCLDYTRAAEFNCAVNPTVGREYWLTGMIHEAKSKKKVVIIGGGPAGMQAAITAKRRGHEVVLFEKEPQLGGKLIFAAGIDFKRDLDRFMRYQIYMMELLNIDVRLNKAADENMIRAENADCVLAAIGAFAAVPGIPGLREAMADGRAVLGEDAHKNAEKTGSRVVVIGGGQTGCELAVHLGMSGRLVSLVEMADELAADAMQLPREELIRRVNRYAKAFTGSVCTKISSEGVHIKNRYNLEATLKADTVLEADTIVLAAGMKPRIEEAESFRDTAPVFIAIGDATTPGSVRTAVRTAFDAASGL